jgi:hypothetical protein
VAPESNEFRRPEQAELADMMRRCFAHTAVNAVLLNLHLSGETAVRLYVERVWDFV